MSMQIHAVLEAPKPRAHGIRVLVVDDHAVVRSGLVESLLAVHDLEIAGEAAGGDEAVLRCGALKPDVVLMDLVMPGTDGVTATRLIREQSPQVQIIGLISFEQDHLVEAALEAGAVTCLMNTVTVDELAAAIRLAHAERKPPACDNAADAPATATPLPALPALTARQREILGLMANGMGNAEIAARLGISLSTVKYHLHNILAELEVEDRAAAATVALQKNLI